MQSIHRRGFLRLASVALCSGAALSRAIAQKQSQQSGEDKPNILLILSDDHSTPHLGCSGDPNLRTPNLDKLAEGGMRFERAYTTAPQCVPSRASLMTGRSAVDIRMTRFSAPLPRDVVTYPELLRKAGYYTGLCGRTFHLNGSGGLPEASKKVFDEHNLRTFAERVDWIGPGDFDNNPEHLRTFLRQVPSGKSFFLQVCYSDPHRAFTAKAFEPDPDSLKLPPNLPDVPSVRKDLAGYYGEIQRLDGEIGKLLAVLDEHGMKNNTIVAFMGDNGAALLRGKGTLYEWGLRVPLIVRWPGHIEAGTKCDALVSGEDLAPTFLEAAGTTAPETMTGVSFLGILLDKQTGRREYAFAERGAHGSGLPNGTGPFDLGRCVITPRYKLIYSALWQLPYSPVDFAGGPMWKDLRARHEAGTLDPKFSRAFFAEHRPMFELYDLQEDPYEFNNLAGKPQTASVERNLKAVLQEWMILNQDYLPLPIPPAPKQSGR
ncbi:MAG: sulfatase [Planctomycetota bacterium]